VSELQRRSHFDDRATIGNSSSADRWCGIPFRGHSKISFPFRTRRGPVRENRNPCPASNGTFRVIEILCGTLIILGLLTRLAAIPLIIDISVAIISTKIPILLGRGFWRFTLSKLPTYGFWSMVHEARVDYAMLLGSVFLLIVGAGAWSIDARLSSRKSSRQLNLTILA